MSFHKPPYSPAQPPWEPLLFPPPSRAAPAPEAPPRGPLTCHQSRGATRAALPVRRHGRRAHVEPRRQRQSSAEPGRPEERRAGDGRRRRVPERAQSAFAAAGEGGGAGGRPDFAASPLPTRCFSSPRPLPLEDCSSHNPRPAALLGEGRGLRQPTEGEARLGAKLLTPASGLWGGEPDDPAASLDRRCPRGGSLGGEAGPASASPAAAPPSPGGRQRGLLRCVHPAEKRPFKRCTPV